MAKGPSARELKWIKQKYSRQTDIQLLQIKPDSVIPEAQAILASELLVRGWDQETVEARRAELERAELTREPTPPYGQSSRPPLLAKIFLFFGGGELLYWFKTLDDPSISSAFHFILSLILLAVAALLAGAHQKAVVEDRNKQALEVARRLAAGERVGPFSVYLRPFRSTGLYRTRSRIRPSLYEGHPEIELETALADSLIGFSPLYALGQPEEHVGAGRLAIEESSWQEVVKQLTAAARLILVLPSHAKGTLWEIEWIVQQGYLSKSIFIMPYEDKAVLRRTDVGSEWRATSAALRSIDLTLPTFSEDGMLFTLQPDGQVERSVAIGRGRDEKAYQSHLFKAVRSLVGRVPA